MKKKIAGLLLLLLGVGMGILGFFAQMSNIKTAGLARDAIYVGQSALRPENDGKLIIVTGELSVTEPAYDAELGITFDAPVAARSAQNIKWVKNQEKSRTYKEDMYGWEWAAMPTESNTYYGKAAINEFSISGALLERLSELDAYTAYDESELGEAGLALTEDEDYAQKYFLQDRAWRGPENMGYYYAQSFQPENYDDVIRYHYRAYLPENQDGITVIGVQNGSVLDLHEDIAHHSFMDGALTHDEVIGQLRTSITTILLTSIALSLIFLITGAILLIRRRT